MGKKADITRQNIRAAAFELFAEYGYKRVTMQDICEKTKLSKGGLYRHYSDKCQLFTDLLQTMQSEESDREQNGIEHGETAVNVLEGFLNHIKKDLNKNNPNINMALYEFCVEYKDGIGADILSNQFRKGRTALQSLMEYGIARGEFHLSNPQGAASAILFLVEGMRMANEVMPVSDEILAEVLMQIRDIVGVDYEA